MKAKKYLKEKARKDQQEIMDADDGRTLRALGVKYPAAAARPKRGGWKKWAIGGAIATASLVLIVSFAVSHTFHPKDVYLEANFETRASSCAELNSEMHDFAFEIDESVYSVQLTRTNDSVSGDVLYYKISLDRYNALSKIEFVAVCNAKFDYTPFEFESKPQTKALESYKIKYHFITAKDEQFGLDNLLATAEIDGKTDTVYVTKYEELLDKPDPAFFGVIESIVQPVNK